MVFSMGISVSKRSQSPQFGTNGPTGNQNDDLSWFHNFNAQHPVSLTSEGQQPDYFVSSSAPSPVATTSYVFDHRGLATIPTTQSSEDRYDMYHPGTLIASTQPYDARSLYEQTPISEQKYLVPPSSGSFSDSSPFASTSSSAFSDKHALHSRLYSGTGLESGAFYGYQDSASPQSQGPLVKVEGDWKPLPSPNTQRQFYTPMSAASFENYAGGIQSEIPPFPHTLIDPSRATFMPGSLRVPQYQEGMSSPQPVTHTPTVEETPVKSRGREVISPAVTHKWSNEEARREYGDKTSTDKIHGVPLREASKYKGGGIFKIEMPKKEGDGVKKKRTRRSRAVINAEKAAKLLEDHKPPSPPRV